MSTHNRLHREAGDVGPFPVDAVFCDCDVCDTLRRRCDCDVCLTLRKRGYNWTPDGLRKGERCESI